MKPKTFMLSAIALAVIALISIEGACFAQSETNLTITLQPGFNLISLPLQNDDPTSSINSVLTNASYNGDPLPVPGGCAVYTWDSVHSRFNQARYAGGDGYWYDQEGVTQVTDPLPPGMGFFFQLLTPEEQEAEGDEPPYVTNLTITVTGHILTGTNSYLITSGYNFYGNFEPTTNNICSNGPPANSFPVVDNSELFIWNGHGYNQALYGLGPNEVYYDPLSPPYPYPFFTDQTGSYAVAVTPPIGSAFLYDYLGPATYWTQVYNP